MNIKKLFFLLLFIFCFKQVMALDCSVPEPECLWNKSKIAFKRNVQNLGNKYLNILIEKYPESDYGIKAKIFFEEKNLKNKKLDDIEIDRIKRFIELHKATIGIPEFSKKVGNYLIKKSDDQFNQNNFDEAILILIQSKNFLVDHKIVNNKILIIENAFNTYLEKEALTNAKYNKFEESYKIIDLLKKRMVSKNQINSLKFKVDQIIYNTLYDKGLHYRKKGLQEESLELFIKSEHFKKTESVKNIINNIIINKIISFVNFGRESLKKYRIKIAKNNFDKASVLGLPLVVKNQLDEEIIEFTILKSLNDNKLDLAAEYLLSAEENQILKYDLDNLWVVYNKLKKKEDVVIYKNVIIYNKYEIINILKQKNISYRPYVVTRPYNNLLNPEIKKIPITLPKPLLKKRLFKFKDMPQQAMIPLPEVPLLEPDSLSPNLPKPMISISLPKPEAKLPNLEQKIQTTPILKPKPLENPQINTSEPILVPESETEPIVPMLEFKETKEPEVSSEFNQKLQISKKIRHAEQDYNQHIQTMIQPKLAMYDSEFFVRIELEIGVSGKITRYRMLEASPSNAFNQAAQLAIRNVNLNPLPESLARNPPYIVVVKIIPQLQ